MLRKLIDYLVLPSEMTSFERTYLLKINKIALGFFALHIPVFVVIAWLNGTGPLIAAALTGLALLGPWLAARTLHNPRHVSIVFGVTAMYVGALLVHFGRGLWTIEMHFYFFVSLALLAVFANPTVILAAAVTVALHHTILWAILPESVFNYDAPFASVAIHALFVVLESVAACFVARSFFDNVIGLERIVEARTAEVERKNSELQLVLDNAGQGFLCVDMSGAAGAQHSAPLRGWFGEITEGQAIWDIFARRDERFASWLMLGWGALAEDFLPIELVLDQLPKQLQLGERALAVEYRPVLGRTPQQILVVVTDASERVARERADAIQRETLAVFEKISRDRGGFVEFFEEMSRLVSDLREPCPLDLVDAARTVHTIKGNTALFGVSSVSAACHEVEARCSETGEPLAPSDRAAIVSAWDLAAERLLTLLGERKRSLIEVEESELLEVLVAIRSGRAADEVTPLLERWRKEPTKRRLLRFAEQALALGERLGLSPLSVEICDGGLRLPSEPLAAFWSSLSHVVRNAVDHGLRSAPEGERVIRFSTSMLPDGRVLVEIADSGAGVDWAKIEQAALRKGLPSGSKRALIDAMFSDGVSTREELSDVSGRGVGLAAVAQICRELGAEISLESDPSGSRFQFILPRGHADNTMLAA